MSGGFRGNSRRSHVEPPLVKLVEQYLYQNKHLSFVNLERMGDEIRKLCVKYNRLPRGVFNAQLKKAYQQYSANAQRKFKEFSGGDIELDNQPLTDETLKQMDGYPSDSDSDLEIDEPANVKDTGAKQMKNLYRIPNEDWETEETPDTPEKTLNGKAKDTSQSTSRTSPPKTASLPPVPPNDKVSDSESDLEIIEEVPNQKGVTSVITNGIAQQQERQLPPPPPEQTALEPSALLPADIGPIYDDFGSSLGFLLDDDGDSVDELKKKRKSESSRGVKRKLNESSDSGGIGNDLGRKKSKKEVAVVKDTGYKLKDFAGSDKVVEEICKLLMHLKHPEVYETLGVTPPRGFLLHGPPGTGKTLLANAIAGEMQIPMLKIAGTELVSGISGESESNIRELFNQAVTIAPCIVFIDEIDSVTPRRENVSKEMERRIVAQLLSCIDDLINKEKGSQVLLIGATNRVEAIDTALRRAGRFDREICLGIPDESSRAKILEIICRQLKLEEGFDTAQLAKLTPGYVGADLQALVREAAVQAVNRKLLHGKTKTCHTQIVSSEGLNNAIGSSLGETGKIMETPESNGAEKSNDEDVIASNFDIKDSEGTSSTVTLDQSSEGATGIVSQMDVDESEVDEVNLTTEKDAPTAVPNPTNESKLEDGKSVGAEFQGPSQTDTMDLDCTVVCDSGESTGKNISPADVDDTPDSDLKDSVESISAVKLDDNTTDDIGNQEVDKNPLRWIKDTAPLTEEELKDMYVTMRDFKLALKNVQPSSKREGFATVPDTTWDDIGALQSIRDELQVSILGPVKHSEAFKKLGLNTPAGVLLCGPPGCGKTLLAKAVANEAGINFISVKGPELLNMYVGESERAVRQCFLRARNSSPCVIFFDELDALCPRRSDVADSGSSGRIVNQLLTEMDGMESRQGVFVMAASNRPDIIDPAVLRPGRLDKILFVNLPTASDRHEILKALTKDSKKPVLADDVNLEEIANCSECEDYTGADLAALVREASIASFRELVLDSSDKSVGDLRVYRRHFTVAFTKTKPSVSKEDRKKYKLMAQKYATVQ